MSKGPLFLFALAALAVTGLLAFNIESPPFVSSGKPLRIQLVRGPMTVLDFPSRRPTASALILFGSGDGGWGSLEESICHAFQAQGYAVAGIDASVYARSDYTLAILQADYATIATTMFATLPGRHPPLLIGGYSMGAAQAIAVAGGPHPPTGLVGLLVIDPLSRGRYGLRESDQMNVLPEGPGTFGAASFAGTLGSLHVIQWHAEDDSIDSHAWLDSLTAPHRFFTFPGAGHGYVVNRTDFIHQLVETVPWLIPPAAGSLKTAEVAR